MIPRRGVEPGVFTPCARSTHLNHPLAVAEQRPTLQPNSVRFGSVASRISRSVLKTEVRDGVRTSSAASQAVDRTCCGANEPASPCLTLTNWPNFRERPRERFLGRADPTGSTAAWGLSRRDGALLEIERGRSFVPSGSAAPANNILFHATKNISGATSSDHRGERTPFSRSRSPAHGLGRRNIRSRPTMTATTGSSRL